MIRVRCCSTILRLDSDPSSITPTLTNDLEQMTYLERIAQCSCVGNSVLRQPFGQSSQVKRRHSSFTTQQLQQQWKSEDILPLFESQLMDFMEGVEVLRELSEATREFRDVISQHKLQRQVRQEQDFQQQEDDTNWAITLTSSLIVLSKGNKEQEEFMKMIAFLSQYHDGSQYFSALTDHLINSLISITSVYDFNTSLIPSLFQYFHHRTSSFSNTLLCLLDACLHEAIISCFETPDLLIPNLAAASAVTAVVSSSHPPPQEMSQNAQSQIPDEIALILQQLASLREENNVPHLQNSNNPEINHSGSEVDLSYSAAANAASEMIPDPETIGGEGGGNDWVTYYDESSARYYLYSESRGESQWLDYSS